MKSRLHYIQGTGLFLWSYQGNLWFICVLFSGLLGEFWVVYWCWLIRIKVSHLIIFFSNYHSESEVLPSLVAPLHCYTVMSLCLCAIAPLYLCTVTTLYNFYNRYNLETLTNWIINSPINRNLVPIKGNSVSPTYFIHMHSNNGRSNSNLIHFAAIDSYSLIICQF